tara:strand:- start:124 stop:378 length:255 start_codon:yes stop_codon:yes gene_type:complete
MSTTHALLRINATQAIHVRFVTLALLVGVVRTVGHHTGEQRFVALSAQVGVAIGGEWFFAASKQGVKRTQQEPSGRHSGWRRIG